MQAWGRTRLGNPILLGLACPEGVWVGSGVSEVVEAFWASQAGILGEASARTDESGVHLRKGSKSEIRLLTKSFMPWSVSSSGSPSAT